MNCNTVEAEEYKGYTVWYKYYKRSNAGYVAWGGNYSSALRQQNRKEKKETACQCVRGHSDIEADEFLQRLGLNTHYLPVVKVGMIRFLPHIDVQLVL